MKTMLCVVALFWSLAPQFAWANDADKCRAVLEVNFQACNEENLPALLETQSKQAPGADRFAQEAAEAFEDIDVYLRLEAFQVIGRRGDMLAARVVQHTSAKPSDHKNGTDEQIDYRRYTSALLPEYERVEYIQTFKREGGKWRLWLIENIQQVGDSPELRVTADGQSNRSMPSVSMEQSVFGNCANGRCRVQ